MLTALGAVDLSSNLSDPIMPFKNHIKKHTKTHKNKMLIFDMMGVIFTKGSFSDLIHTLVPRAKFSLIRAHYRKFRLGKIDDAQFWNGLTDDPNGLEERFLSQFKMDKEFLPLIKKLKREGYSTAILSNIPREWKDRLLKKFKFEHYFDALSFSCDIGVAKPDKRAYLIAAKSLDVDPDEAVFIDDELENLAMASRLGMTTIYMARRKEKNRFSRFKPDFRAKRLSQIAGFLKSLE